RKRYQWPAPHTPKNPYSFLGPFNLGPFGRKSGFGKATAAPPPDFMCNGGFLRTLCGKKGARWSSLLGAAGSCALGALACGDPAPETSRPPAPRCVPSEGVSTSPRSIAETVDLLNALPKPVTLPCFLS